MYVVIIGNMVWAYGPFDSRSKAMRYAERWDISSARYNPGRWQDYSVTIVRLEPASDDDIIVRAR